MQATTTTRSSDGCRGRELRHEGDTVRCWTSTLSDRYDCGIQLLVGQVLQDVMNGIFGRDAHAFGQADEISGRG
jgi:hypothetical protein